MFDFFFLSGGGLKQHKLIMLQPVSLKTSEHRVSQDWNQGVNRDEFHPGGTRGE